jgi:hypothetical protein
MAQNILDDIERKRIFLPEIENHCRALIEARPDLYEEESESELQGTSSILPASPTPSDQYGSELPGLPDDADSIPPKVKVQVAVKMQYRQSPAIEDTSSFTDSMRNFCTLL